MEPYTDHVEITIEDLKGIDDIEKARTPPYTLSPA